MNKIFFTFTILIFAILSIFIRGTFASEPIIQATIATYPVSVSPGSDGYIQLTLKNVGNFAANRVKVSVFNVDKNIITDKNWISEVGVIGPGERTTVLYKFSVSNSATSGLYVVTFNIDYCKDSSCRSFNTNAIITVQSPSFLEITSLKPYSLGIGDKGNITVRISNRGSSEVNNLVVQWYSFENIILPLGSDNKIFIQKIDANSYHDFQIGISISPNARPGIYPLNVIIQYQDKSGINQTVNSVVGFEIKAETDFDIGIEEFTLTSVTLAIANIGTTPAYSTVVTIPKQENFKVSGSSSKVIGNLNPGDYTLVSFQIIPTENYRDFDYKERNLKVKISYTDALGVRRLVEKEIDLIIDFKSINDKNVRSNQTQNLLSNGFLYIIIGIVGIAVVILSFKTLKSMRKKK